MSFVGDDPINQLLHSQALIREANLKISECLLRMRDSELLDSDSVFFDHVHDACEALIAMGDRLRACRNSLPDSGVGGPVSGEA